MKGFQFIASIYCLPWFVSSRTSKCFVGTRTKAQNLFLKCLCLTILFANGPVGYSQTDLKPVVGVERFTSEVDSKYADAVAEKVAEVVTNTRRFTMVERISKDKIHNELEFQKSEAFLDSKTAKQGVALAAQFQINGHILKMSIYKMKNADGSVN